MSITKLSIDAFLAGAHAGVILDVRSPGEYAHAHIPGAVSLPLFTDEERRIIGTAYKQESRERAVRLGLDSFGKNMLSLVDAAEKIIAGRNPVSREIYLHCWRGGMRSSAVAWLLDLYGFKVYLLSGGYKAYRNWAIKQFEKPYRFCVVGGYTGSNKTGIIHALKKRKEKVIDLEDLAGHKGSVFGNMEKIPQPSQEMFENLLAEELVLQSSSNEQAVMFIEDESQRIGDVNIPIQLFLAMRQQPVLFLDIPFEERLAHLVSTYGKKNKEQFINGILRIKKRLGGLETKNAINFILEDDLKSCFAILLKYYDKFYLKSSFNREDADKLITTIQIQSTDIKSNTDKILQHVRHTS